MNIKILFWTLDIQLKLLTLHPEQSVCGVWDLLVGPVWRHIEVHGGSCVQRYHCSGYLSGIIFTPVLQENAQMLLNCIYPQQLLHDIWAGLNGQFRILYREPSIYTFLQKIKKELTFGHSIQSSNCVFFRGNRVLLIRDLWNTTYTFSLFSVQKGLVLRMNWWEKKLPCSQVVQH